MEQKSNGALIGSIIIIVILIIGGIYFWKTSIKEKGLQDDMGPLPQQEQSQNPTEQGAPSQATLNHTSDSTTDIESDVNSTNFDNLDSDINQ